MKLRFSKEAQLFRDESFNSTLLRVACRNLPFAK